ncbi:uncharacterized protein PADG_03506 [Paracoccidioides brasiliensis Pb18]|uniref:Smr domain-containing protein n=1 Tax=Paracoccidioides brasiliensis (strain Pb18) TaxID=502780 RepID=C1G8C0_PARBD|nr:uncharacterized protein PADG_03506 [Paracoccidioides brasiliensis Pb18]EEH47422.1 hypothetical protein PADG_03506 [Paracoccidioides brasiliensis Pb18]
MGDSVETLMEGLENEYCPPIDPALFAALASDHNLLDDNGVQQLRDTLDALKVSAVEQQDALFDPSGTSGQDQEGGDQDEFSSEQDESNPTLASLTSNLTSLRSEFSAASLNEEDNQKNVRWAEGWSARDAEASPGRISRTITGLTLEGKTTYLSEMFPSIDNYTIVHTLRKCDGDIDRSIDVLNLAFFDDHNAGDKENKGSILKGIEGFAGDSVTKGRRKANNKRNIKQGFLRHSQASIPEQHEINRTENKWDNGEKDVEFICSRTYLSRKSVTSAYHANGASLPNTLHALASAEAEKHARTMMDDLNIIPQLVELQQKFDKVCPEKLAGLLHLARNCTSSASELATFMMTVKPPLPPTQIVQIKHAPVDLGDSPTDHKTPPWTQQPTRDHLTSRAMANSHALAAHAAFNKATAAYRRGKSDHLMGGAAGYYSAIGREHMEQAKKEAAAAAEALVESQSSSRVLDLHGVSTQHAVGIAKKKVRIWWDSLGDTKYAPGGWSPAQEGYRIVTGLGRHSKNGTARVGPAVARALAGEGWKVEVGEGFLTVTGVARR